MEHTDSIPIIEIVFIRLGLVEILETAENGTAAKRLLVWNTPSLFEQPFQPFVRHPHSLASLFATQSFLYAGISLDAPA
jgi:hypothetical protein